MPDRTSQTERQAQLWPEPSPDRRRIGWGLTLSIGVLLAVSFRSAMVTLPVTGRGSLVIDAAALTGVVAVLVLRSIPLRWIVRLYAIVSGVLMLRFGWMRDAAGVLAAQDVLLWVLATAGALALCPSPERRGTAVAAEGATAVAAPVDLDRPRSAAPPRPVSWRWSSAVRCALAVVVLVAAVAMLAGPIAGDRSPTAASGGDAPDQSDRGSSNALAAQEQLDMTSRPRLTDEVAMIVRSDIESFWRTSTFDRWDGSTWSRSDGGTARPVIDGQVGVSADDVGAAVGNPSTQEFRLMSRFANALPVAPSVESVQAEARLYSRPDGTLLAPGGLGKGASYTVQSRQVPVTSAQLKLIDGTVPNGIAQRYASSPTSTARVRTLANQIVTDAGADTEFAKVKALEKWMGENLKYSLDAPLAPQGVDVVDDFLFESKVGWCEQIASSLVVMLREVGVPTRLATGFAPGQRDGASGRFIVRERDAHAWAEVWFPDVGWVPFDPTAEVPLSGDAAASRRELPVGFAGLAVVLLFVAAVALLSAPLARRLHSWRQRRSDRRALARLAAERWDVRAELDLDARGVDVGRPRAPFESVAAYGRELAAITGDDELARVGQAVDDHRYTPPTVLSCTRATFAARAHDKTLGDGGRGGGSVA